MWDGDYMHDRPEDGCWADLDGRACSAPAGPDGLCPPCRTRLTRVDTEPNVR